MSFTDYIFFPALAVFFLLYYLMPMRGRWYVLLLGSILFYCTWGVGMLPFICGAVLVAWLAAVLMEKTYAAAAAGGDTPAEAGKDAKEELKKRGKQAKSRCRLILWAAIVLIFGFLICTKIRRYMPEDSLFSSIIVPLGISYYSMSLVGYLADVYWKKEKAEKNVLKLALFTFYFPKILEGPIEKQRELTGQLVEGHAFEPVRFCHGLQLMIWGYFKKLCIADRLSLMINPVFASSGEYGGCVILLAGLLSVFQLYCDFSGCMDIAMGISEALGIRLTDNFSRPFHSKSAAEFWRRWHMSLGRWFRDYVYMPLVIAPPVIKLSALIRKPFGKRAGKAVMSIVPLAAVWTLTALWHGTGWNYMLWGAYWGILIIISNVFEPEMKRLSAFLHLNGNGAVGGLLRKLRTFFLFAFGRIIVMSGTPAGLLAVIRRIFCRFEPWHLTDQSMYNYGLDRQNFWLAMLLILFLLLIESKQEQGTSFRDKIDGFPLIGRWLIYYGAIMFILIFGIYGSGYNAASFVYMAF